MTELHWRYFGRTRPRSSTSSRRPHEAGRQPAYCAEKLTWHEARGRRTRTTHRSPPPCAECTHVYARLVDGTPLAVTPAQVRKQIAVHGQVSRNEPLSRDEHVQNRNHRLGKLPRHGVFKIFNVKTLPDMRVVAVGGDCRTRVKRSRGLRRGLRGG
jgi:hypothetical protein